MKLFRPFVGCAFERSQSFEAPFAEAVLPQVELRIEKDCEVISGSKRFMQLHRHTFFLEKRNKLD